MRKIIGCMIMTGMLSVFTACAGYMDTAERYVLGAAFCALMSEDDSWSRSPYRSIVTPYEFFDAKDFGRGRDSMYGNPPFRYEGDHTGSADRRSRQNARRDGCRGNEFSMFGRYAPLMLPDVTYEK